MHAHTHAHTHASVSPSRKHRAWKQRYKLRVPHPVAVLQPAPQALHDEQQFGLGGLFVGPALLRVTAVEDGAPSVHRCLTLPHQLLPLPHQAVETHLRMRTHTLQFLKEQD